MACFSCGIVILWSDLSALPSPITVNTMFEIHARKAPLCPYLVQCKGQLYIDSVMRTHGNWVTPEPTVVMQVCLE